MYPSSTSVLEKPEISIVIPLFNEQENLKSLHQRIGHALEAMGGSYEIVFVNDGSRDATPRLLGELYDRVMELERT